MPKLELGQRAFSLLIALLVGAAFMGALMQITHCHMRMERGEASCVKAGGDPAICCDEFSWLNSPRCGRLERKTRHDRSPEG
jgi:hypothetical protein